MITSLGRWIVGLVEGCAQMMHTLVATLGKVVRRRGQGGTVVARTALMQVLFTGVEALPLVAVIALVLGAMFIVQFAIALPGLATEMLGQIVVVFLVREIGPIVTALIVASRTGTAIATELGNMKIHNEIKALQAMGIHPLYYVVWPRLVGVVVAVLCLLVYFDVVVIMGGYLASIPLLGPEREVLLDGFFAALEPADVALLFVKGFGMGLLVAWPCCHFGLSVKSSPTEVPQRASRAVVTSVLACFVFNAVVSAFYYLYYLG